jgi:hypothetical protein
MSVDNKNNVIYHLHTYLRVAPKAGESLWNCIVPGNVPCSEAELAGQVLGDNWCTPEDAGERSDANQGGHDAG